MVNIKNKTNKMKVNCQKCNSEIERSYIKNVLYTCTPCKNIRSRETALSFKARNNIEINRKQNLDFISKYPTVDSFLAI